MDWIISPDGAVKGSIRIRYSVGTGGKKWHIYYFSPSNGFTNLEPFGAYLTLDAAIKQAERVYPTYLKESDERAGLEKKLNAAKERLRKAVNAANRAGTNNRVMTSTERITQENVKKYRKEVEDLEKQIADMKEDIVGRITMLLQETVNSLATFADFDGSIDISAVEQFAKSEKCYVVTLRKRRSTWNYFTTNPQGGGFGSNHAGAKRVAFNNAIMNIPNGFKVVVITEIEGNITSEVQFIKGTHTPISE